MKKTKVSEVEYSITDFYTPVDNEVVIEINLIEKTESGIYFAEKYTEWDPEVEKMVKKDSSLRKDPVCKVVAVGPSVTRCKVGDFVLVANRSFPMITLMQDENHLQCRDMDILGIVNPNYKEMRIALDMKKKAVEEKEKEARNKVNLKLS